VFGTIAEAVSWITPHVHAVCGPSATRVAIQAAVDEFCADFRRREAWSRFGPSARGGASFARTAALVS